MKVAVTGAEGFLGWHTRCALRASGDECVPIGRASFADPDRLDAALVGVGAVLHLAGVNRDEPEALRAGNVDLARRLTAALDRVGTSSAVVYANSIQSGNGTP